MEPLKGFLRRDIALLRPHLMAGAGLFALTVFLALLDRDLYRLWMPGSVALVLSGLTELFYQDGAGTWDDYATAVSRNWRLVDGRYLLALLLVGASMALAVLEVLLFSHPTWGEAVPIALYGGAALVCGGVAVPLACCRRRAARVWLRALLPVGLTLAAARLVEWLLALPLPSGKAPVGGGCVTLWTLSVGGGIFLLSWGWSRSRGKRETAS